ncbi:MAG: ferrochelatase [Myxococcales bacterium]|nr:ferrochelatase [Myxococcales bacterium]
MESKTGVLVVNLGSPDAPTPSAVRRYLREFLGDERVLDMNPVGRFLLLEGIILPLRPAKSAEAYQQIWTDEGSPLLVHGRALVEGLRRALPADHEVVLAMRYGQPSLASGLDELRRRGCDRLVIFPLYPQYASSTTGSTLEAVYRHVSQGWNTPWIQVVPPYYDDAGFIDAFAAVGQPVLDELKPDHVLLSFHGVPERHVTKSDDTGLHCLNRPDCCATITDANRNCYRAHCFATARALAAKLGVDEADYTICFQSRLGRTPWIKPYTDETILQLAKAGKKRLAVFCPAFTADCLETLEEIGIRAVEDFEAAGGEALRLVPSLNATPAWVAAAARLITQVSGAPA